MSDKYQPKHRGEPTPMRPHDVDLARRYWLTAKGEAIVALIREREARDAQTEEQK